MRTRKWLIVAGLTVGCVASGVHAQVVIDMPAPKKATAVVRPAATAQAGQVDVGDVALDRYARARSSPRNRYPARQRGWPYYSYYDGYWGFPWGFGWRGSVFFGHHHHHGDVSDDFDLKNNNQKNEGD